MEEAQENQNNRELILAVAFDADKNSYIVDINRGQSVLDAIFAMAVVAKCLVRDGVVESTEKIEEQFHKYLTDSQYDEVKE